MKLYILGPMTGHPEFNAPAFREAASELRRMGHDVLSPVELDEAEGFVHKHHATGAQVSREQYLRFLRRDLALIAREAEGGVALAGWEESEGATKEVILLRALDLPIYRIKRKPESRWGRLVPVEDPLPAALDPRSGDVLEEAARLVAGDRGEDYGHPRDDFERTAGAWRALFGWDVQARQVALAMVVVKLSRLQETPDKRDSIVDIAGYARTYEMVLQREAEGGSLEPGLSSGRSSTGSTPAR